MQPPPQAIPSGLAGPPPAGSPRGMFWGGTSPYRRPASNNAPVAPITCPLPPVTDPFALNRQMPPHTPLGSSSKSSLPALHGSAFPVCSQWSGLPAPHTNAGDSSQGPQQPLPGPVSHPRTDASSFPTASIPSLLHGPGMSRSTEIGSVSGPETQNSPYPLHYIPGVGPDPSHGRQLPESGPGPDHPLSRPTPQDGAVAPAASTFFSQPSPQMPGQWVPVQGGSQTSQHHCLPCPEGPVQSVGPQTTSASHFSSLSNLHPGPGHEPHSLLVSPPAPLAGGEGSEVAHLRSGKHFLPQHTSGQHPRTGSLWASQEFMHNPEVNKHVPDPAPVNLLAQGNSPENQVHCSWGTGAPRAPLAASSGSLSMFFQGEEAENEENLSSEKASFAGRMDLDGFPATPGLGHPLPPAHGAGGVYQAFPKGSNSETAQQEVDAQPYFSPSADIQHDKPTARNTAGDMSGGVASTGTLSAHGSQYENVENLEFVQNQEVLPSEPPRLDLSSSNDHFRYGALPRPAAPRPSAMGSTRGGLHLEAPDVPLHPPRSDSVSSSYSGHSHRSPPGSTRPQELLGTFIQQEIGKPEDDAAGSFFKQIDSSPVGGEVDETLESQNYRSSLSQPSTPSPPKPTGIFQTSANSSFEPVKSHLVGVKPVEADRANMVVEVKGTCDHQKQHRSAARMPHASPGNLEQPPDNMETPQACPLPLTTTTTEAGHPLPHTAGSPLDTTRPTPEKRPSVRTQGAVKCESPATTLWAQNELPDFGGNVLLAPAAPALYVPAKPQPPEVVQPLAKGVSGQQPRKPGAVPPLQNQDGPGASENLENPPEVGEEGALPSQASAGYASLLSSPPTESLQNQPVLIAQPDHSYNLAQPVHFPVSLVSPKEKNQSWGDAVVGDKAKGNNRQCPGGDAGDHAALSGVSTSTVTGLSLSNSAAPSSVPQGSGSSEMASSQPTSLLGQALSHPVPKTPLVEGQKTHSVAGVAADFSGLAGSTGATLAPPACSPLVPSNNEKADQCTNPEETAGALDFPPNRTWEGPGRMYSSSYSHCPASQQTIASHPRPSGPGAHNADHFYQQVTKDAQDQCGLEKAQPELVPPQPHQAPCSEPSNPESPPTQGQAQQSSSPAPTDTGQPLLSQPPPSSSASVVSTSSSQAALRSEQPWLYPPLPNAYGLSPQDLASHCYYRPLYDAYQSQYPSLYLPDPGTASLYYQDVYGLYDPRYRPYDSSASTYTENYRYPEPERPSSRASHCSDRPTARQGYPEGYGNSRSGWSSQSDYYANYYSGQCDYGDSGRWDRYYGSRFRDTRVWDRRSWYDAEHDPYRKEAYAYGDRLDKCDDHWRYDPRFTGSFDDDTAPPRDPYGEEVDRRSIHSEHSARSLRSGHSLPSRRSSLSSHSRQSQIYRSQHVTTGSFEAPPPPGSFHGDGTYGAYGSNMGTAHGFPEYGYPVDGAWPTVEQVPSRPTSPEKFSVPHICARFGPGGHLIKVVPNLPSEGQPALVEVHSLETLLQHTPEQEEMRSFPGPLGKDDTHKVDVINFAQNKATKCLQNENLIDKESASLLWNFIILLCRQNGTVVGTDIAELLLRDHRTVWLPGKSPHEANLIDFTNEAVGQVEEEESGEAQLSFLTDSQTAASSGVLEKETERFRELLLYGRKKDALESAMKNGLWGHALLLASKMDSRTHARVMTRFANSLPINDPLQTVYQLMSGRMPAASTCCGDEKWGDWRPHLAMVLSNLNNNMEVESRAMTTMGDTLASRGLLDAAHFCYLMAQVGFGVYTKKTTKLVLIGSNHSLPFLKFATNEAIQRTEAYEYAQSLGAQTCLLPNFQVFKFIYSCRLAEMGLATQAFHYCEVIAKSILAQPASASPVLVSQLVQMASQLRLFDPQLKEKPEEESFVEPAWLVQLRCVERQIQEGAVLWNQDGADPQQCPSTPSSEVEQLGGTSVGQPAGLGVDNPLLMAGTELLSQDVRLLPSAPQRFPADQPGQPSRVPMFPGPPSRGPQELGPGYGSQGSALGLPEHSRPDAAVPYLGPPLSPGAPSLPESGPLHQETRSLDPGVAPQDLPATNSLPELSEEDFGGKLANLGTSRMAQGLESPPAWDYNGSSSTQPAPPLTPTPETKRPAQAVRKEAKETKKSESWFSRWLPGKKRTEAYLPDDKNKSIVWDEKKNQWVNLNEPEEEKKAPPPPPTSFPRVPQMSPVGPPGPPTASVNMFSRKAGGSRARYVDVLNPSGTQRNEPALAPADLFAPLAPLPIPPNLLIPNPDGEEPQPADRTGSSKGQVPAGAQPKPEPSSEAQELSSSASAPGPELPLSRLDGSLGGELSRCSSVSSLSQEVSRHFHQAPGDQGPAGPPPGGAVPFYNPAHLVQTSATSASSRLGRIGQRKYPVLN